MSRHLANVLILMKTVLPSVTSMSRDFTASHRMIQIEIRSRKSHHDPSSTLQNNCETTIPPSYESKSNLVSNWRQTEVNFRRIQPNLSNETQNQIDNSRFSETKSNTIPSSVEVYTKQKLPTSSECRINDSLTEQVRDRHGGILADAAKRGVTLLSRYSIQSLVGFRGQGSTTTPNETPRMGTQRTWTKTGWSRVTM